MTTNTSARRNDRAALKAYLQQYHLALRQKDILDDRRDQLNVKLASATDIDARIKRQQEHLARILSDIMDVIDILPPNSPGRTSFSVRSSSRRSRSCAERRRAMDGFLEIV